MPKLIRILLGALAAIAVIACIAVVVVLLINRGGEETPADPLIGTKWQASSYYNPAEADGMASPLGGMQLTADFADGAPSENGVVSGSAGCNTYSASYAVDGDSLSIGEAASTMMFCEGLMGQEAAFLALVPGVGSYSIEATKLTLKDATGQVVVDLVAY